MFYEWTLHKSMSGIYNVETIGEYAFSETSLESCEFPSKCTAIPFRCFENVPLKNITGLGHIFSFGPSSFSFHKISNFEIIPEYCKTFPSPLFYGLPFSNSLFSISYFDTLFIFVLFLYLLVSWY